MPTSSQENAPSLFLDSQSPKLSTPSQPTLEKTLLSRRITYLQMVWLLEISPNNNDEKMMVIQRRNDTKGNLQKKKGRNSHEGKKSKTPDNHYKVFWDWGQNTLCQKSWNVETIKFTWWQLQPFIIEIMKIIYWNYRGLGIPLKTKALKDLIRLEKFATLFI